MGKWKGYVIEVDECDIERSMKDAAVGLEVVLPGILRDRHAMVAYTPEKLLGQVAQIRSGKWSLTRVWGKGTIVRTELMRRTWMHGEVLMIDYPVVLLEEFSRPGKYNLARILAQELR